MNRRFIASLTIFVIVALVAAWNGRQTAEALDARRQDARADYEMRIGFQRVLFRGNPALDPAPGQIADETAPWLVAPPPPLAALSTGRTAIDLAYRPTFTGEVERLESAENPTLLAFGHFDLAAVLLLFLPWLLLFAPIESKLERLAALAAGAIASLIAAAMGSLTWSSADTWFRLIIWLALVTLYARVWLSLRDLASGWRAKSMAYVLLVIVMPALASVIAATVIPPGSRVDWARARYEASREPALRQSKTLSPFYERFPEFAASATRRDYDAARLALEPAWRAALDPIDQRQQSSVNLHRMVAQVLRVLSPTSLIGGALLETAGSGDTRASDFAAQAASFARDKWSAYFRQNVQGAFQPATLDKLPAFEYQAQGLFGWLLWPLLFGAAAFAWPIVAGLVIGRRR